MKKFFALYMMPIATVEEWMKNTSKEDMDKSMVVWKKWMDDNKSIFADQGSPLGKTKRVTKDESTDTKNDVTGYSVVLADSHEAATKLFAGHPHLEIPGAYIDILTIPEMLGM